MQNIKKELENILQISNIYVNDDKKKNMEKEIEGILVWVEKLNEINTDNIEPMIHPFNEFCTTFGLEAKNPMKHHEVLQNAPHKNSTYIIVPKVI